MSTPTIRRVEALLQYSTIVVFFSSVLGQTFFSYFCPRVAEPEAGRIYPLNVHGTPVFLTVWEHLLAGGWTWLLALALAVVWVLMTLYRNRVELG
jgi:hypothetical protein